QSLPELVFAGGAMIGCEAGTLNVPKIKGTHTAMKSGMVAAEAAFDALAGDAPPARLDAYSRDFEASWAYEELHRARNFRPSFARGMAVGTLLAGIDQILLRGSAPWTLHHRHADHETLDDKTKHAPIDYPKPDGVITFDKLSS